MTRLSLIVNSRSRRFLLGDYDLASSPSQDRAYRWDWARSAWSPSSTHAAVPADERTGQPHSHRSCRRPPGPLSARALNATGTRSSSPELSCTAPSTAPAVVHLMTRSTVIMGTVEDKRRGQDDIASMCNWWALALGHNRTSLTCSYSFPTNADPRNRRSQAREFKSLSDANPLA
jgi:hypothetical protein